MIEIQRKDLLSCGIEALEVDELPRVRFLAELDLDGVPPGSKVRGQLPSRGSSDRCAGIEGDGRPAVREFGFSRSFRIFHPQPDLGGCRRDPCHENDRDPFQHLQTKPRAHDPKDMSRPRAHAG